MMMAPPIRKPQPAVPSASRLLQRSCLCDAPAPAPRTCSGGEEKRGGRQSNLVIGATDDPQEMEADRVADQILSHRPQADFASTPVSIRRLARSAAPSAAAPASVDRALASPGRALETPLRRDMEQRFGWDFSSIRVHHDSEAAASANDIGALAYTAGSHIVFAPGMFSPEAPEGRRLLAHELTHVVQQTAAGHEALQMKSTRGLCGGWTCNASPCAEPDPGQTVSNSPATTWKIRVMIDVEAPTAASMTTETVGHTYVEFLESTGKTYTFGFYPTSATTLFFSQVAPGCVVHPDNTHRKCVDYIEEFTVTKTEYDAALAFAIARCDKPGDYDITENNCTSFVQDVVESAGRSLPPVRSKVGGGANSTDADNPNALFEGLRKRDLGSAYKPTTDTSKPESDDEIRIWVSKASAADISNMLFSEMVRMISTLLSDWIDDTDVDAVEKLCAHAPGWMREGLQKAIAPFEDDMFSPAQKIRVHRALYPAPATGNPQKK